MDKWKQHEEGNVDAVPDSELEQWLAIHGMCTTSGMQM